jgi:hypothetical protein
MVWVCVMAVMNFVLGQKVQAVILAFPSRYAVFTVLKLLLESFLMIRIEF